MNLNSFNMIHSPNDSPRTWWNKVQANSTRRRNPTFPSLRATVPEAAMMVPSQALTTNQLHRPNSRSVSTRKYMNDSNGTVYDTVLEGVLQSVCSVTMTVFVSWQRQAETLGTRGTSQIFYDVGLSVHIMQCACVGGGVGWGGCMCLRVRATSTCTPEIHVKLKPSPVGIEIPPPLASHFNCRKDLKDGTPTLTGGVSRVSHLSASNSKPMNKHLVCVCFLNNVIDHYALRHQCQKHLFLFAF